MFFARFRFAGFAMICAAVFVAGWKTFEMRQTPAVPVPRWGAGGSELTIPVEIVETGKEPRIHEVRLVR